MASQVQEIANHFFSVASSIFFILQKYIVIIIQPLTFIKSLKIFKLYIIMIIINNLYQYNLLSLKNYNS